MLLPKSDMYVVRIFESYPLLCISELRLWKFVSNLKFTSLLIANIILCTAIMRHEAFGGKLFSSCLIKIIPSLQDRIMLLAASAMKFCVHTLSALPCDLHVSYASSTTIQTPYSSSTGGLISVSVSSLSEIQLGHSSHSFLVCTWYLNYI